jgi:D-xylose transport system substrate-binding protein
MKALTLLLIFVSSIAGADAKPKNLPKIGFILATMQEERYQRDKQVFEDSVRKLGGEPVFASCNNSEQTQAAQVENLLSQGIKVLVLQAVNGDTASALARASQQDGVPIVAYDRLIMNAPVDAYITEDSEAVGKAEAEAAVKFTHGQGNYVLLMGEAGQSGTIARTNGVLHVLEKHPKIKIVVRQNHKDWSPDLAMQTTENALARFKNDIQAVIANNSGMANGAVQALQEQKLAGKVFVAGADADLTAIRNIVQGRQQVDVMVSIQDQARHAAEVAMALARKEKFHWDAETENGSGKVKTVQSPIYPIDSSNIEERIIKTGFHPRAAVYGK